MDKIRRSLCPVQVILLLVVLLAGCAQETVPQPTFTPPPDTPTASPTPSTSPTAQSGNVVPDEETVATPQQITASPTQTSTATATRVEVTTTPSPQTAEPETADAAAALTPLRLQNMPFSSPVVAGGEVSLENGTYEAEAAPGSATQIRVELSDTMVFGEVGGEYHAVVILVSDGGGSGTFYTLHLVGLEDGDPYEVASVLLGDRVLLHDLALVDGRIEVELTRAGPDDPLCCPTERVRQVYALQGDALVLVEETVVAPPPTPGGSTADLVEQGLTLDVTGVASMYAWTIERAAPQADPPLPAHLLMTFDGHKSAEALTANAPLLTIFPVEPYLGVAKRAGGGQTLVEEQIARLWQLVEMDQEGSAAPQGWMPLLPPTDAPVEDWSDFAALDFVRGHGVRYLHLVGGALAYTYQGVTEDGRYAVSLTWPLGAADAPDLEALNAMISTLALGEAPGEP